MATAKKAEEAKVETVAEQTVEEAPKTEVVRLFKDAHRYSAPVFVSVNGESYLIQRGIPVEVPAAVAEVLRHSEEMDNAANAKIEAATAAAAERV